MPEFLPPANEVWGKVIFLHLFVNLFMGGGSPIKETPREGGTPLSGRPLEGGPPPAGKPPWKEAPPWQGDPPGMRHPPAGRPPWQGDPLAGRPPRRRPPSGREALPPTAGRPPRKEEPPRRLLLRAVRILLECILVVYRINCVQPEVICNSYFEKKKTYERMFEI